MYRIDFFVEPPAHLDSRIAPDVRSQIVPFVNFSPQFDASTMVDPGCLLHRIETKWNRGKKLCCRHFPCPVISSSVPCLSCTGTDRFKYFKRRDQFIGPIYFDFELSPGHLQDFLGKSVTSRSNDGEIGRPGGDHVD